MTTNLRQRMTEDMQVRNLAPLTQSSYVQQVSMFARHFDRSPTDLGLEDIRDYQLYLTNQKKLDASSIKVAVSAMGVPRMWGDGGAGDMTGRSIAGWGIVDGVGLALG
jgi:hypothetical protein